MDPSQFLSALLAIVVIDLVLAGDNAIVIALAARGLPPQLQRRAILWGTVGAVVVRSGMTVAVVWLLQVPGLLAAGGLMLLYIAWKLLVADDDGGPAHSATATGFWGAMRTIVIADAVMGLDNVLAVAGAAHGSYALVIAGLAISVPIVVWGSSLVLKLVDRFPVVIYLGAGVLVWTAVKMVTAEPLLAPVWARAPLLQPLAYAAVPLLLAAAFVANHRRVASRIAAQLAGGVALATDPSPAADGGSTMLKVLVPIDGSDNALRALRHAIEEYRRDHTVQLHLVNVQPRLSRHVARLLRRGDVQAWHRAQSEAALAPALALLQRSGVSGEAHQAVGDRVAEICRLAESLDVHHLVVGTARKHSVTRMLEDSTTLRLIEQSPVPVSVVTGEAVSRWERLWLPAGALAGLGGLAVLAFD